MQNHTDFIAAETDIADLFSVAEFCKRYRLDGREERRLRNLLGEHAPKQDLLANARRDIQFG
ncbi:hypothetical protein ACQQ2Q_00720 [Agrobacterium sp. ES01]|uniref:hypothetical protein n=1 Tax=Agrobacterium sp. ES01 TaxID=3420714 RepID=UPI003D0ECE24